jgi:pyruvate dehydrogenase E2 component (dihydrolipoamide acetyltransferase)
MAVKEFAMPDLGEGLTESELVSWNVAVGDTVELNQVIAEVETAKALVQLPSPFAGTVSQLFVEPGTTVLVGSPIVAIEVEGGEGTDASGKPIAESAPSGERNSVLVGYGPPVEGTGRPTRRARSGGVVPAAPEKLVEPAATEKPAETQKLVEPVETPAATVKERPRSTPPVRKLAADLGIDLTTVTGTGPDGLITRDDIKAYSQAPTASAAPAPSRERETRTPIKGVRKHTAAAMVSSAFTAPHVSEFLTVDVTPTMELLEFIKANRAFAGHRINILTVVAKAILIAISRNPSVNSRWDEAAGEIVQFGYVNLGIAAATQRGLIVPNIKDADQLDLVGLADAIGTLTETARAGTTSPADLGGGTISITNIGVFGIDAGTPILNPGEAAILAMGAIRRQPWEYQGEVALRSVMTLSLSFDHRLVDGEQGSRFLADVGTIVSNPAMILTMV